MRRAAMRGGLFRPCCVMHVKAEEAPPKGLSFLLPPIPLAHSFPLLQEGTPPAPRHRLSVPRSNKYALERASAWSGPMSSVAQSWARDCTVGGRTRDGLMFSRAGFACPTMSSRCRRACAQESVPSSIVARLGIPLPSREDNPRYSMPYLCLIHPRATARGGQRRREWMQEPVADRHEEGRSGRVHDMRGGRPPLMALEMPSKSTLPMTPPWRSSSAQPALCPLSCATVGPASGLEANLFQQSMQPDWEGSTHSLRL